MPWLTAVPSISTTGRSERSPGSSTAGPGAVSLAHVGTASDFGFRCLRKGGPLRAFSLVFLVLLPVGLGCHRGPSEPLPSGPQTGDAMRPVPRPLISRSAYEDDVLEAVFRYQFSHDLSGLQGRARAFFVSVYDGDPSNRLMDRFEGHEPPVKGVSECEISSKARGTSAIHVADSSTGEPGLIYRVERIKRVSDTELR